MPPVKRKRTFDIHLCGAETLSGRYLRRFWQPIFLSRNLCAGRAKPIHVLGQSFTLYRGETGKAHLIDFRCPHRGTQLSTGTVEGDELRCLYHGWLYDSRGHCVEQPGEPEPFCHKIKIGAYPVEEYLGLVFAYFGEGAPPPLPRYEQFESEGYLDQSFYTRDCNYFQNVENYIDEVHVAFTHRASMFTTLGLNRDVPRLEARETEYGVVLDGKHADGNVRINHLIMPNILILQLPSDLPGETGWSDYIAWRVPIDDERHISYAVHRRGLTREAAEAYREKREERRRKLAQLQSANEITARILAGEIDLADVLDRADIVNIQDNLTQCGQGKIADRSREHLGRSDVAIILMRKLWRRELRALASGGKLTEWKLPRQLVTAPGV
jgi:5,5'-dehydrodivanillate O-demethylase